MSLTDKGRIGLRLYIVEGAPNSQLALRRLRSLCETYLSGRYDLEVIDLHQAPERLLADGVLVTPTLIRYRPLPEVRIIGTLEDTEKVRQALGCEEGRS